MAVRRGVASVLAGLLLVAAVAASVGVVAAQAGGDTPDEDLDENTTDTGTNTTDTTGDSLDDTTNSTDGLVDSTENATDDSTTNDSTTDDGTTDASATDGEPTADDTTDGTGDTSAVDATSNSTAGTQTGTGGLSGTATTYVRAADATSPVDAATTTLNGTADALTGTLADATGTALLGADTASTGLLGTEEAASERPERATRRESADWTRENRQTAAGRAASGVDGAGGVEAAGGRSAPRSLPLPERAAAAAAFVASVVAVARPPFLTRGASRLAGAAASRRLTAGFDRFRRFVAPLGYSRYDDSDPLDHDARAALYDAVQSDPGVYLSELSERAGVNLSTARHHVRVLEDEDLVTSAKPRGKRRYYPAAADDPELEAALSEPATAAVLDALADHGGVSVGLLADELDRDPSTVSHHLDRLAEDGLVERERRGRTVVNRLAEPVADALADSGPAAADD